MTNTRTSTDAERARHASLARAAVALPAIALALGVAYAYLAGPAGPETPSAPTAEAPPARVLAPQAPGERVERLPAGNLRARSGSPWRAEGSAVRQIAELSLLPTPKQIASRLPLGWPTPPPHAACALLHPYVDALRVFHSSGAEVRSWLDDDRDSLQSRAVFEVVPQRDGYYEIYYTPRDAAAPAAAPAVAAERLGGVTLRVFSLDGEQAQSARSLKKIVALLATASPVGPPVPRLQIDDCVNPIGRPNNYLAVYQGHLACPVDGMYQFAIDADDRAILLIDGARVLEGGAPGKLPDSPFQTRVARQLSAGLHLLTFYHVQSGGALRARLAWRPPGRATMGPIPPSAFATHVPSRTLARERSGAAGCDVCFTAAPVRRMNVNRLTPVTEWRLAALGSAPEATGSAASSWVWREGERELASADECELFVSRGADGARAGGRTITLDLEVAGRVVGSCTHTLHGLAGDALEEDAVSYTVEFVSAPPFLYPHEPFEVNVAIVNESEQALELEAVELQYDARGEGAREWRTKGFTLPAVAPGASDVLARRMNRITRRYAVGDAERLSRIVYAAGPPGAPAVALELRFVDSRVRAMPTIEARYGALMFAEAEAVHGPYRLPARAVIVMPYDTEADLRRWRFLRGLSDRAAAGDNRALLFGDTLASPGALAGEGLAPRVRQLVEAKRVALSVVPVSGDEYPALALAARVDEAVGDVAWLIVWVSLGNGDARRGTEITTFERAIDFAIDRVRVRAPGTRLVVVGPTPELGRESVSVRYAVAARRVCERHRVDFVDAHDLIVSSPDHAAHFRDPGSRDRVSFPYPVGHAMDRLADAVVDGR